MTATDELRRLLDERGVEHEVDDAKTVRVTRWRAYGDWVSFIEYDNGDTKFCIDARRLTPEQAIAATQRGGYQGFWTHDGTLYVELPKLPESISVRLPDKRDREVRSAKVWRYTQEPETCHDLGGIGANGEDVFYCDKCGCVMSLYDSDGTNTLCTSFIYDYPRYCPACGRKVV